MSKCIVFVQSGGPTAVINQTLASALKAARETFPDAHLMGARFGFEGLARGDFVELNQLSTSAEQLERLGKTPGCLLGSTRKTADIDAIVTHLPQEAGLVLIGGNGTHATARKLSEACDAHGKALTLVAVPKTVDNDLATAVFAPGFLSAAQFIAQLTRDIGCDHRGMQRFDKVTVIETMGRDSGWLALAASAFRESDYEPPHLTMIPEVAIDEDDYLNRIARIHADQGYAIVVVNEALRTRDGGLYGAEEIEGPRDGMGRLIYSLSNGTSALIASRVRAKLGLQARAVRTGIYGRAASAHRSSADVALASAVGTRAIATLAEGFSGIGPVSAALTVNEHLCVTAADLKQARLGTRLVGAEQFDSELMAPSSQFLTQLKRQLDRAEPILLSL